MGTRVKAWLRPHSLCGEHVPHPPHEWTDERDDEEQLWCRGRIPFTIEAARRGAELVTSLEQAELWAELCGRTPSGRQFIASQEWRLQMVLLRTDAELARLAAPARPWWRRLLGL